MGASSRDGRQLTSVEICAGAGGQAVGLHKAGYRHLALVEYDTHAVATLRENVKNWPEWGRAKADRLVPADVREFRNSDTFTELALPPGELDLLAGGVPCPPFSLAGRQLGENDERDLFPEMLKLVDALRPKSVLIENVRGILAPRETFASYRKKILDELWHLGYDVAEEGPGLSRTWRILEARDYGVPQLRPRAILVAIRRDVLGGRKFVWPTRKKGAIVSVADALRETMWQRCEPHGDRGRKVFLDWLNQAEAAKRSDSGGVAPTLVGGSRKHGGADLGPTRAKKAWGLLGVDGMGIANDPDRCDKDRDLFRPRGPMLTVEQAAIIQGFPASWNFQGGKTAQYRQVGNAFPPPVAEAIGRAIASILIPERSSDLLKGLVMEDAGLGAGDSGFIQSQIPESAFAEVNSSRNDRRDNLVGADR
ncbi:DNA (cytosine-5-)-methyltransferase [Streptomyces sp. So13.3]|uniref:DNA cytosine methyltransferase n=1 Tax=Streptomyces sp. So13.3 TaxID=2136173 RepID=UPI001FD1B72B|nr:DNA (cytosine-5-)-methyltransferase [Streptomyces sp. So13.3]